MWGFPLNVYSRKAHIKRRKDKPLYVMIEGAQRCDNKLQEKVGLFMQQNGFQPKRQILYKTKS